jgi:hypothetical protein
LALAGVAASCLAGAAGAQAHSQYVRDEGYLRYVRSSGSQVIDEGRVHGSLSGFAQVRFSYTGNPVVSASFIIWGPGWSLSGHGSGRLSHPNSSAPSLRGRIALSRGSGRYAHAGGWGELFGVFFRRSYALDVQALGTLYY